MTGTIHQTPAPFPVCTNAPGTEPDPPRLKTSFPHPLGNKVSLDDSRRQSPATEWVRRRLAPTHTPRRQSGGHRRAPASPRTVGPAPGCQPSFPLFCFFSLPDREVLGEPFWCPVGVGPPFRSTAGVRAESHLPHVSPLGVWVPVKPADFLPVDVAGSQYFQETRDSRKGPMCVCVLLREDEPKTGA